MRATTRVANHDRSYPDGRWAVRMDDTDTYHLQAAARELEAHLLHEQARHLADVRALLADLHQRDGVAVEDATLDAQAEQLAAQDRGERFLAELATRIHPGSELGELAAGLDDHALGVWREAAASLVEGCPPSLVHLRWQVEEEQRGELRGHAHQVRTEHQLRGLLRDVGLVGRWWRRGRVAELRGRLADCRQRRERAERRLAYLDAKLLVIQRTEQARGAWLAGAREVLTRGVAALGVLEDRAARPAAPPALPSGAPMVGALAAPPSSHRPPPRPPGRRCRPPGWSAADAPTRDRNRQRDAREGATSTTDPKQAHAPPDPTPTATKGGR